MSRSRLQHAVVLLQPMGLTPVRSVVALWLLLLVHLQSVVVVPVGQGNAKFLLSHRGLPTCFLHMFLPNPSGRQSPGKWVVGAVLTTSSGR